MQTPSNDKKDYRIFETEEEVYQFHQNEKRDVIIYQGVVYDVADYKDTHPGGSEKIEEFMGKNIEKPFEEAEHTKAARNIFQDL